MKTAFIEVADTHGNSTVALCSPDVVLDDGQPISLNKSQKWLWSCWLDFIEKVKDLDVERKIVCFGGDISEVDAKNRTNQLISTNEADIQKILSQTYAPLIDEADEVLFFRGTEAHTGKSSSSEETFAMSVGSKVIKDGRGNYSWQHLRGSIEGVRFDIAHHAVGGGGLPWNEMNVANILAAKTLAHYTKLGLPYPNVVLRSHVHHVSDSGMNFRHKPNYDLQTFTTPAWQLKTSYVYRKGWENTISDIGGYIFVCENGEWTMTPHIYIPEYDPEPLEWKTI